jgi:hypothetical protein
MIASDLLNLFRIEVRDQDTPQLWSDDEIYSYMDDAQKMFCRFGGGIADSTTAAVTHIDFSAGDTFVTLDPCILKIRAARLTSNGRDVELLNFEDVQSSRVYLDYGFRTGYTFFDPTPGEVRGLVLGMEPNKARLVRVPIAADGLDLIVYRLPLAVVDEASKAAELEIDAQHHRHLLSWMKYLAHTKQDAETYDRGRAADFKQVFEVYCDMAKGEREKKEHKYRLMGYGGI